MTSLAGLRLVALAGFDVQVYDTRVEEGDEGNTYHGRRDRHVGRRGECSQVSIFVLTIVS